MQIAVKIKIKLKTVKSEKNSHGGLCMQKQSRLDQSDFLHYRRSQNFNIKTANIQTVISSSCDNKNDLVNSFFSFVFYYTSHCDTLVLMCFFTD